jgi:hypothetical protein
MNDISIDEFDKEVTDILDNDQSNMYLQSEQNALSPSNKIDNVHIANVSSCSESCSETLSNCEKIYMEHKQQDSQQNDFSMSNMMNMAKMFSSFINNGSNNQQKSKECNNCCKECGKNDRKQRNFNIRIDVNYD